ncbi:MAG: Gfo/Idh/MocA family oxidoreductase [Candidatus Wallbacteria bacterium]|nr:Gfo/Idh/MocA family oxidoreductase [Candidatus Wallbacteria bacterium]
MKTKNFALIGAAGYIAPRHMKAISETGHNLVAATDPHDSVGILDSHFENVSYFREFERFDRHLEKLKRKGEESRVHYVSICSPNYLHDAHIRFALRIGADAICEKPLVLNPWNLDALSEIEGESGRRINTILQLRLHPSIIELKKSLSSTFAGGSTAKPEIVLTYITSRGNWYLYSWKGEAAKSGGLATNIGVHFYDMLLWLFGPVLKSEVHLANEKKAAGYLELSRARVRWLLSIDRSDLPFPAVPGKQTTYRSITMDGQEIEFSGGFTDLHTESYKHILAGQGFGIPDVRPTIDLVYSIRNAIPTGINENSHPALREK